MTKWERLGFLLLSLAMLILIIGAYAREPIIEKHFVFREKVIIEEVIVEKEVETETEELEVEVEVTSEEILTSESVVEKIDVTFVTSDEFKVKGVLYWQDWKWTWYSERILPGEGLVIPGRHTDKDGYICDEDGYICVASDALPKGTVLNTPFGKQGKVYDTGCGVDTIDIYVNW